MNALGAIGSVPAGNHRRVRCCVCGFAEVLTDEVLDGGVVFLAECPRCDHRWTSREPIAADPSARSPLATAHLRERAFARHCREVQPAA